MLYNLCVFFPVEPVPLEVVREVAALLKAGDLGELTLKSKGDEKALRLKMERETFFAAPVASPISVEVATESVAEAGFSVYEVPVVFERTDVLAPCVGVFRAPKKPLSPGDEVTARQLVGVVESLRVPNEIYAPFDGRVVELCVVEGQGVEWGQILLVLEPASSS